MRVVREEPDLARFAATVADAMHSAQLSSVASDGLRVRTEPNGETRLVLARVSEEVSRVFTESLDELVSPPAAPRYVVPRYTLDPAGSATVAGWRVLLDHLRPDGEVWHAVPTVFGVNAGLVRHFTRGWHTWIGLGEPVYTGNPTGAGALAASAGMSPLDVTTVLRPSWA